MEYKESKEMEWIKLMAGDVVIDDVAHRLINYHLKKKSVNQIIDDCISEMKQCREFARDGQTHRLQTNSYRYKFIFAEIAYIYETFLLEDGIYDIATIANKCQNEHQLNLIWEADNPIIDYKAVRKTKSNSSGKRSTNKNTKLTKEEKQNIKLKNVADQLKRSGAVFTLSFNMKAK